MSFYLVILLICIFCYGRILVAIRRQASVMAAHSAGGSNTSQDQTKKIKTNVIKTMLLVSGLYAVTWAPVYVHGLLKNLHSGLALGRNGLYAILSIGYLYICVNPLIYATKFDPVKRVILGVIPCKKSMQPLDGSGSA